VNVVILPAPAELANLAERPAQLAMSRQAR